MKTERRFQNFDKLTPTSDNDHLEGDGNGGLVGNVVVVVVCFVVVVLCVCCEVVCCVVSVARGVVEAISGVAIVTVVSDSVGFVNRVVRCCVDGSVTVGVVGVMTISVVVFPVVVLDVVE